MGLENLVLSMWNQDTTIIPSISAQFGFYAPGQDNRTLKLQELPLYQEDWLGLQQLENKGKLHFR